MPSPQGTEQKGRGLRVEQRQKLAGIALTAAWEQVIHGKEIWEMMGWTNWNQLLSWLNEDGGGYSEQERWGTQNPQDSPMY